MGNARKHHTTIITGEQIHRKRSRVGIVADSGQRKHLVWYGHFVVQPARGLPRPCTGTAGSGELPTTIFWAAISA